MFTQFLIIIFISSPSTSSAFDFVSTTVSVLPETQAFCTRAYVFVWCLCVRLLWMRWSEKKDEEHSSVCCGVRCGFYEHLNFGGQFGF